VTTDSQTPVPLSQPIGAGIVTALVGFTSSFAVVLTGLHGVGASGPEAASGLLTLCVTQGVGILWLARRYRIPITLAWSTPGAALLAGTGAVAGGWPAAVGAFVAVGLAVVLTGLSPRLGRLIAAIPTSLAQAMLAGVLVPLCLAPVTSLAADPAAIAPVALTWLIVLRLRPRWAVPAAFAAATVVIAIGLARSGTRPAPADLLPSVTFTTPAWTWQALLGVALPLYIVTMASQNIPGTAVLSSFGYRTPWRAAMTVTGLGTVLGAPSGGHAINLAAISAALSAAPEADPDPSRRWVAAWTAGWSYLALALLSTAVATLVALAPAGVVETVAGLALLATLGSALASSLRDTDGREAAVVTFLVAASGLSAFGIGAAFWALVAGLAVRAVLSSEQLNSGTGKVVER